MFSFKIFSKVSGHSIAWSLIGTVALACAVPSYAQVGSYPDRPVKIVVAYGAGNTSDSMTRVIADELGKKWGESVIVENKPGLGGNLGGRYGAQAKNDGYTFVLLGVGTVGMAKILYKDLGYDPVKDLDPVVSVASASGLLVVSPAVGVKTFQGLVTYSKEHPGALRYGTAGIGTIPHLNMEMIKDRTGLVAQQIAYKTMSGVLLDLLGDRIQLLGESNAVVGPSIEAKKTIPLLVWGNKRLPEYPNLPTAGELYPGLSLIEPWMGLFAPSGTSPAILEKVSRDVAAVLAMESVKEKLARAALTPLGEGPVEFRKSVANDVQMVESLIKKFDIKIQ